MEYPGVRLGQRGGLFDLYQYYLGGGDEGTGDEGPVTTDPFPGAGGGDATNTQGVELSRIKQPTGSPFRIVSGTTMEGEKFSDLPTTDPRYMSEADQRYFQNRADAGEFFYGSPYYIGGAPGNIVQSGPGRQFDYNPLISAKGAEIDPISARDLLGIGDDEDERFSFASLRQSIMDNPLFRGVSAIASPVGALAQGAVGILQGLFPATNERSILERRAGDQGIAVDDIGRVAFQDFGIGPDGKTIALGAYDPSGINIMAGYNLSKITQETIDKRRARAKKNMSPEGFEEFNKALTAFENTFNKITEDKDEEIIRREYIDREKKREKIQKDLAAAGFGESGAVGIDRDPQLGDSMDFSIQDYDDAGTYTPPENKAPSPQPDNVPRGIREDTPGGGEFSAPAPSAPRGGGADYSNVSTGGGPPGTRSSSPSTRSNNPWGRYANGGIVDLL